MAFCLHTRRQLLVEREYMPSNRPFLPQLNLLLRLRPCSPGSSVPIIGWLDDDGISNRFRVWDRGALERHVLPVWFPVRGETHGAADHMYSYAHFESDLLSYNFRIEYDWAATATTMLLLPVFSHNLFYDGTPSESLRIMGRDRLDHAAAVGVVTRPSELRRQALRFDFVGQHHGRSWRVANSAPRAQLRDEMATAVREYREQLNDVSWADDESSGESVQDDEVADARRHCAIA